MSPVNLRQPVALYAQIAADLTDQIARMSPDERLPSAGQLVARYGVSRVTIQRALTVLRHEGIVYSRQGQGVFVAPRADSTPVALPTELALGLTARASALEMSREALLADLVARYLA